MRIPHSEGAKDDATLYEMFSSVLADCALSLTEEERCTITKAAQTCKPERRVGGIALAPSPSKI